MTKLKRVFKMLATSVCGAHGRSTRWLETLEPADNREKPASPSLGALAAMTLSSGRSRNLYSSQSTSARSNSALERIKIQRN